MQRDNARIALVQALDHGAAAVSANLEEALRNIEDAARQGAELVCFPEGYPGPFSREASGMDVPAAIREAARRAGVYVVASRLEAAPPSSAHYLVAELIDRTGEVVGAYRRCSPAGPVEYEPWNFTLIGGDVAPPVFDTSVGKIAVLFCSELFVPELARVVMHRGAEILLNPTCRPAAARISTWQATATARGIENLFYVGVCQRTQEAEPGVGFVAGPQGPVAAVERGPSLLLVDLDLGPVRAFRPNGDVAALVNGPCGLPCAGTCFLPEKGSPSPTVESHAKRAILRELAGREREAWQ